MTLDSRIKDPNQLSKNTRYKKNQPNDLIGYLNKKYNKHIKES
jgi:hypothetical protein